MATSAPLFDLAVRYHGAGDLRQAARLYQQIIDSEPTHAPAHVNLGAVLLATGKCAAAITSLEEALRLDPTSLTAWFFLGTAFTSAGNFGKATNCLRKAVALNPGFGDAFNNLGIVLAKQNSMEEATTCFRRAIRLNPKSVDALVNLGHALNSQAQAEEALNCFRQALKLDPGHSEAHYNLGNILKNQNQLAAAVDCYREAIRLAPRHADAHNNLGIVLCEQKQLDEAAECFRGALRTNASHLDALNNLGFVRFAQKRHSDSAKCFRDALRINSQQPHAHNHLGNALFELGKRAEAAACYREAVRLHPSFADAHYNLANTLQAQGQLDEAVACFQEALRLRPTHAQAHNNLGNIFKDQGRLDEALTCFQKAVQLAPEQQAFHSNMLLTMLYHPDASSDILLEKHRRWERDHAATLAPPENPQERPGPKKATKRLRIGYISPNFCDHIVARNMLSVLRRHDHRAFEIFLYSHPPKSDNVTEEVRRWGNHWRDIGDWSDGRVADQVREDGIDILVDLALHTGGNRLAIFAREPAPIQVTFGGYPGTTGLATIDYRLTDPHLDPPGLFDHCYTEQSRRLPHSFWCYEPKSAAAPVAPLPALTNGYITFGCLNNFCKINDKVLDLWGQVLTAVDNARLLVQAPAGSQRERLTTFLAQRGIAPHRVAFCTPQPYQTYLSQYDKVDIGLDTFPYNGHTTSLDSFWMGVPVVTLVGQTVVGRAGLSQLTNLGLKDLAAFSPDQFVRLAVELAKDQARLKDLRSGLRQRMQHSPLMDAVGFTRGIEQAFRGMWRDWCGQGQGKTAAAVQPYIATEFEPGQFATEPS